MMKLIAWTPSEKPNINEWYRVKFSETNDFYKIQKDFYSSEAHRTFYRIISFYDGGIVEQGLTLNEAREFIRNLTYRRML